ncbi:hypothetical protein NDU88_002983 [Pleurodeles waltl]|uniref:Uncharacterized protein n=1 Tax=Pleurodeles waltl TaxID=8319 RepID=A0AAV7RED9_PLEWA|nr:hypothetical protein NDU88_002983 [Pleurodeles waltl]
MESPENTAEKMTTGSTPERSRGAISTAGGAGQWHRDPQSSTSGAGGARENSGHASGKAWPFQVRGNPE